MEHFNPRFPRGKRRAVSRRSPLTNTYFNPRFPRGKRPIINLLCGYAAQFQSTLPAGEATCFSILEMQSSIFQSTLPAGEATFQGFEPDERADSISIHASRGGSDFLAPRFLRNCAFQSTLPAGEATRLTMRPFCLTYNFNPRFPRGKRRCHSCDDVRLHYFNPRFPRGKRLYRGIKGLYNAIFQSTLPAGEATIKYLTLEIFKGISIHASRGGSDTHHYHITTC